MAKARILLGCAIAVAALSSGCGKDSAAAVTTDEKALEQERTKGRETRENLEGYKPPR